MGWAEIIAARSGDLGLAVNRQPDRSRTAPPLVAAEPGSGDR